MTGNRYRRVLQGLRSMTAAAAVYSLAIAGMTGLAVSVAGSPAAAAPHGPHGGPHGGAHAFVGGHGGPHGRLVIHGGPHHGHWFGGRPGWIHGHRYFWGSLWFCWYPVGYNGPGWYVCGAN